MATALRTPGVYIEEKNAFPNSVVEVPTAVPAFIGYTEVAVNGGKSLLNTPTRIASLQEYHNFFGYGPDVKFTIGDGTEDAYDFKANNKPYTLAQDKGRFNLYSSMRLFFDNGGGPCYIVSIGDYSATSINMGALKSGIELLIREEEPTMVVIPDAVLLEAADCYSLQQNMLDHCGNKMKSRFAILDVYDGFKARNHPDGDVIDKFRGGVASDFLKFGAAYYPWVNTTIVQASELNYTNINNSDKLIEILTAEVDSFFTDQATNPQSKKKADDFKAEIAKIKDESAVPAEAATSKKRKTADSATDVYNANATSKVDNTLNQTLLVISTAYKNILTEVRSRLNLLPPSGAIAGIYTRVDNSRGVWKAPANASVASVISPAVNITHDDQEDLNVTLQGKSINAIRSFIGEGVLVWGARTLDGNSQDWRYVNVRRTVIMLEQSIKYAAKAYVFEPNDANTWVSIKSMISNYLTGKWKEGALVGAKPDDAFEVSVGLGSTMTANDILDGIMNITVKIAVSRPAEFIVITFQQQMQKS